MAPIPKCGWWFLLRLTKLGTSTMRDHRLLHSIQFLSFAREWTGRLPVRLSQAFGSGFFLRYTKFSTKKGPVFKPGLFVSRLLMGSSFNSKDADLSHSYRCLRPDHRIRCRFEWGYVYQCRCLALLLGSTVCVGSRDLHLPRNRIRWR